MGIGRLQCGIVLKHLGFHLDGGAEFWDWMSRERNDSCGLEQSLNNDGTCYWQGSAPNASGSAVRCCEQSGVLECLSLTPSVCCAFNEVDCRPPPSLTLLPTGPAPSTQECTASYADFANEIEIRKRESSGATTGTTRTHWSTN